MRQKKTEKFCGKIYSDSSYHSQTLLFSIQTIAASPLPVGLKQHFDSQVFFFRRQGSSPLKPQKTG